VEDKQARRSLYHEEMNKFDHIGGRDDRGELLENYCLRLKQSADEVLYRRISADWLRNDRRPKGGSRPLSIGFS